MNCEKERKEEGGLHILHPEKNAIIIEDYSRVESFL